MSNNSVVQSLAGNPEDQARVALGQRRIAQLARAEAFSLAEECEEPVEDPGPWDPLVLTRGDRTVRITASPKSAQEVSVAFEEEDGTQKREILDPNEAFARAQNLILRGWLLEGTNPRDLSYMVLMRRAMADLSEDPEMATFIASRAEFLGDHESGIVGWVHEVGLRKVDEDILDAWPTDDFPKHAYIAGRTPDQGLDVPPEFLIVDTGESFLICELSEWAE